MKWFMIGFWTTLTVFAILFVVVSILILMFLHGHDKGREKARILQMIGLFMLLIYSTMLLMSSANNMDLMITIRLLLKSSAFALLAISYVFELKYVTAKEKKPKKARSTAKKTKKKSKK